MEKVGFGWRATKILLLTGAMAWACSDTDEPGGGGAPSGEQSQQGGEAGEPSASPGGHGGTGGGKAGGSPGVSGSTSQAGATDDGGRGGAPHEDDEEPGAAGARERFCDEAVPVAPSEESGGAAGSGGADGSSCVDSLATLCDPLVNEPSWVRCPGYAGSDHNFAEDCKSQDPQGELECAATFPSSCGGYSLRVNKDRYLDNRVFIWHFDAEGKLVGAVVHPNAGPGADGCESHFYGEQCSKTGDAIDLCDFEGGACPRPLSENPGKEKVYADLRQQFYMFGGEFLNDCGGFTAIRSGEHRPVTMYTFDLEGNVLGVLRRGAGSLCEDGSVRLGNQYGEYCPPNEDQPFDFDCVQSGAGGCPN